MWFTPSDLLSKGDLSCGFFFCTVIFSINEAGGTGIAGTFISFTADSIPHKIGMAGSFNSYHLLLCWLNSMRIWNFWSLYQLLRWLNSTLIWNYWSVYQLLRWLNSTLYWNCWNAQKLSADSISLSIWISCVECRPSNQEECTFVLQSGQRLWSICRSGLKHSRQVNFLFKLILEKN